MCYKNIVEILFKCYQHCLLVSAKRNSEAMEVPLRRLNIEITRVNNF